MATSKNETIERSRGRTITQSDDQGKHSHSNYEDTGQEELMAMNDQDVNQSRRTKGTTRFPKPEIGIETIRCKQGIVTVPKLHLLEILEFERG